MHSLIYQLSSLFSFTKSNVQHYYCIDIYNVLYLCVCRSACVCVNLYRYVVPELPLLLAATSRRCLTTETGTHQCPSVELGSCRCLTTEPESRRCLTTESESRRCLTTETESRRCLTTEPESRLYLSVEPRSRRCLSIELSLTRFWLGRVCYSIEYIFYIYKYCASKNMVNVYDYIGTDWNRY